MIVQRADVRVVERGNRAGFTLEASPPIGIADIPLGDDFDGDRAIEPGVPRLVHLAHAAGPKGLEQLIGAESRARGQPHVSAL